MSSTLKTQLTNARKNSGFSIENGILHYSGTAEDFNTAIKSKLKADPTIDGQISLKNAAGELVVISIKEGSLVNGKKTKAKKDPNAPKRPLTSYFHFMQEKRASLVAAHPTASAPEIGKLAGEAWATLTPAQRKPYDDKAAAAKAQYAVALAAYKAGSSTAAAESASEESEEEVVEVAKPKKAAKKAAKSAAAPVAEAPKKTSKKAAAPASSSTGEAPKKTSKKAPKA